MEVGQIVICTDARYSEERLKEGWRYVVEKFDPKIRGEDTTPDITAIDGVVQLYGVEKKRHGKIQWWKSSRFRPLTRKEVEDDVNQKIADKITEKCMELTMHCQHRESEG